MSPQFSTLKNSAMISEIPLLAIEDWRRWIIETCQKGDERIVALFSAQQQDRLRLFRGLGEGGKGELHVAASDLSGKNYPSLTPELPQAHLFEREIAEEYQIVTEGHPWLKPLRKQGHYPFYRVEGEEVHEVAVGPVHAGIIEPGHFRFQCHGEKVFHLEIRLGYQHRGVERRMVEAPPDLRAVLAESVAGDTVIGHALAYTHALEALCSQPAPPPGRGPPAR